MISALRMRSSSAVENTKDQAELVGRGNRQRAMTNCTKSSTAYERGQAILKHRMWPCSAGSVLGSAVSFAKPALVLTAGEKNSRSRLGQAARACCLFHRCSWRCPLRIDGSVTGIADNSSVSTVRLLPVSRIRNDAAQEVGAAFAAGAGIRTGAAHRSRTVLPGQHRSDQVGGCIRRHGG